MFRTTARQWCSCWRSWCRHCLRSGRFSSGSFWSAARQAQKMLFFPWRVWGVDTFPRFAYSSRRFEFVPGDFPVDSQGVPLDWQGTAQLLVKARIFARSAMGKASGCWRDLLAETCGGLPHGKSRGQPLVGRESERWSHRMRCVIHLMRRAGLPNVPEYTRWSKCMSWNWEAPTEQIGGRSGKLADPLSVHSQNSCCFKGIALEFILPAPVAFAGTPFHFISMPRIQHWNQQLFMGWSWFSQGMEAPSDAKEAVWRLNRSAGVLGLSNKVARSAVSLEFSWSPNCAESEILDSLEGEV